VYDRAFLWRAEPGFGNPAKYPGMQHRALEQRRYFAYFLVSSKLISEQEWAPRSALFYLSGVNCANAPERMENGLEKPGDSAAARSVPTERFIRETGPAAEIAALAEPVLEDMGFRLVRAVVSKRDGGTIQIMADRPDGTINVDDCAVISRRLSPLLDAHDPVEGRYFLEVSSPGIDRILVRPTDFEDWAGYEAKVELKEMIDGRRRFRGMIEGYEDGELRLAVKLDEKSEPQVIGLPVELIDESKLVLTDDLIRASLSKAKAAGRKWAEGGEIEDPDLEEGPESEDLELNDGPDRH
jgi:ribosome maturation factor RimP